MICSSLNRALRILSSSVRTAFGRDYNYRNVQESGFGSNSPSRAGKAVTGREVDGWTFWSYGEANGTLKKLDTLRKESG